jgi:hypothetical protein
MHGSRAPALERDARGVTVEFECRDGAGGSSRGASRGASPPPLAARAGGAGEPAPAAGGSRGASPPPRGRRGEGPEAAAGGAPAAVTSF